LLFQHRPLAWLAATLAPLRVRSTLKGEVVSASEGSGATERKLKPEGVIKKNGPEYRSRF